MNNVFVIKGVPHSFLQNPKEDSAFEITIRRVFGFIWRWDAKFSGYDFDGSGRGYRDDNGIAFNRARAEQDAHSAVDYMRQIATD